MEAGGVADWILPHQPPDRRPGEADTLAFSQQLGEMSVVHSLVTLLGQSDNTRSYGSWGGIRRETVPVPVGKGSSTLSPIRQQKSPPMTFTYSE